MATCRFFTHRKEDRNSGPGTAPRDFSNSNTHMLRSLSQPKHLETKRLNSLRSIASIAMHHGNGNGAIEEDPEIMPFRQEIFEKPEKTAKLEKLYLVSP